MGACNIHFTLKGQVNEDKIIKAVNKQRREDKKRNGHQEGYSGDWQTVGNPDLHAKIFSSRENAVAWCYENVEKRDSLAVHYREIDTSIIDKKLKPLHDKIDAAKYKYNQILLDARDKIKNAQSKLVSCKKCQSKINRAYVSTGKCLICSETLLSETALNKLKRYNDKFFALQRQVNEKREQLENKLKSKAKINTLVYGLAAE